MKNKIAILLATYNGAKFLDAQLASYEQQTLRPKWIVASDDGSQDETIRILSEASERFGRTKLSVVSGPGRGHKANFASLLAQIPSEATHIALSDQDDVWLPHKLAGAISALEDTPPGTPALYGSRTFHVTTDLSNQRPSPLLGVAPSFKHAITQNFAGGNTMVLNAPAIDLVRYSLPKTPMPVHHDWWLYQIITGCGGRVIYDPKPTILYRQHPSNAIGANEGPFAAGKRALDMVRGKYCRWNKANFAALEAIRDKLTPEARETLDLTQQLGNQPLFTRLNIFRKSGIHRASKLGQLGLWASVALKRY